MTDSAFDDLARMTLQAGAVHIIVGLQTGVFGVLRPMAPRTVETSVPGAGPKEALACGGLSRGCRKSRVGRGAPCAC